MLAARAAKSPEYYLTPDCPMEGESIEARWGGKDAERLDLPVGKSGEFGTLSFMRLAKGLNPESGSKLTARLKENRRDAIDLTVTVPKEVSLLIEVAQDERVKAALWDANDFAMRLWQKGAKVRVRKGGVNEDRETGSMIWASFYHGTTRPISEDRAAFVDQEGKLTFRRGANDNAKPTPDPHAHIHNYVPNVSHDRQEGIWKALKRHHFDLPRIEAKMNRRLAKNLRKLGYDARVESKVIHYKSIDEVPEECRDRIETGRGKKPRYVRSDIKVRGIDPEVVDLFSRRQDGIKAVEDQRGKNKQKMTEKYKARASQMIREPKSAAGELTRQQVHRSWVQRMTGNQFNALAAMVPRSRAGARRSRWRESMKNHWHVMRNRAMQPEVAVERQRGRER